MANIFRQVLVAKVLMCPNKKKEPKREQNPDKHVQEPTGLEDSAANIKGVYPCSCSMVLTLAPRSIKSLQISKFPLKAA
uniref:Uncharacterized protein n=1 Tax=Romanomermis culicivorax TaxID=13658 RepID=A0A915K352_ROMCU